MNVSSFESSILSPQALKNALPLENGQEIETSREEIKKVLFYDSKRFLVIVGPCSVHDEESVLDYATRLSELQKNILRFFILLCECILKSHVRL